MASGYGPPLLDFSPIGNLAKTFFDARDAEEDRKQKRELRSAMASLGQGDIDYTTMGRKLLSLGDIGNGIGLLKLGQTERERAAQAEAGRRVGLLLRELAEGGGAAGPVPTTNARVTPRSNIDPGNVHIAETEEDVQRLERAQGMYVEPDLDKVVRTIYGEAGNQGPEGQAAVAHVIANRAREAGMTPTDVVLAKGQFEPWSDPAARARMESLDPNSAEYTRLADIARSALTREAVDPTGGATHFYAPKAQAALGRVAPSWDDGTGVDIGDHRFFRHGYRPQGRVQVAQADLPAAGAQNAQGFVIPGQTPASRLVQAIPRLMVLAADPNLPDATRQLVNATLQQAYRERDAQRTVEKDRFEILKTREGQITGLWDKREGRMLSPEEAQQRGITPQQPASKRPNPPSGYQYDDNGKLVPIPGGPKDPDRDINEPLPAEIGARFGLANQFFKRFEQIEKDLLSRDPKLTGWWDAQGFGESGALRRDIKLGSEAMVRMLTGAGMSQTEAQNEVRQYLPDTNDNAATVLDKVYRLRAALRDMQREALIGRRSRKQIDRDYPAFEAPSFSDVRMRIRAARNQGGQNSTSEGAGQPVTQGRTSSGIPWSVSR